MLLSVQLRKKGENDVTFLKGTGGHNLQATWQPIRPSFMAVNLTEYGYARISTTQDWLKLEFYTNTHGVMDEFVISSRLRRSFELLTSIETNQSHKGDQITEVALVLSIFVACKCCLRARRLQLQKCSLM